MNYEIYNNNSKEWVLLIHGLGGSIRTWKYQIKDLKDYNIIAVELEGHGGSSIKRARHLLSRSAEDINEILEKENVVGSRQFKVVTITLSKSGIPLPAKRQIIAGGIDDMLDDGSMVALCYDA